MEGTARTAAAGTRRPTAEAQAGAEAPVEAEQNLSTAAGAFKHLTMSENHRLTNDQGFSQEFNAPLPKAVQEKVERVAKILEETELRPKPESIGKSGEFESQQAKALETLPESIDRLCALAAPQQANAPGTPPS